MLNVSFSAAISDTAREILLWSKFILTVSTWREVTFPSAFLSVLTISLYAVSDSARTSATALFVEFKSILSATVSLYLVMTGRIRQVKVKTSTEMLITNTAKEKNTLFAQLFLFIALSASPVSILRREGIVR